MKCSLGLGKLEWLPATSRESWVFFLRVIFLFKRGHYFAKTSNEPTIKKITNLRYLFSDYVDLGLVHFYTSFINPEILLHTFPDSPTDCYMTLVYCLYLMDMVFRMLSMYMMTQRFMNSLKSSFTNDRNTNRALTRHDQYGMTKYT